MEAIMVLAAKVALDGEVTKQDAPREAPELSSAKAFLLNHPFGAYTCARAVPSLNPDPAIFRLVSWEFHLNRLCRGLQHLEDTLLDVLRDTTTTLVNELLKSAGQPGGDKEMVHLMVTVLWTSGDQGGANDGVQIHAHVCPMPQVQATTANVLVNGDARVNAERKHSRWIADRVPLENRLKEVASQQEIDLHESILSTDIGGGDRLLLEGLITNFFVVKNGSIYTSARDVIAGSTRELVLMACDALGIPVVLEAPRLSEIASWQGAFITSAVRIVIPIARVIWFPNGGVANEVCNHELDSASCDELILSPLREHIQLLRQNV